MKNEDIITDINIEDDIRFTEEANGAQRALKPHPKRLMGGAFILVMEGSATITINIADYEVGRNSFISITPGSIVQYLGKSDDFSAFYVALSPEFLARASLKQSVFPFLSSITRNPVLLLDDDCYSLVNDYFLLLRKIHEKEKGKPASLVQRSLILSLMYQVNDIYESEQYTAPDNRSSKQNAIYKELIALVMKHYTKERKIAFYAEKLCLTPKYLSFVIREESGKRVSDLITRAVIADAKSQLKSTNLTVQQISESLNFPDPSLFGKYFRKHTGMTPIAYRNS